MADSMSPIIIKMLAETAQLARDMAKAKSIVGDGFSEMNKAAATVKKTLAGLGVTLSAAAFGAWIRSSINAADETVKLAQKMGVATKEVAGLQLAFDLSGSNAQEMQTSIARLSKEMANGNAAFERMGINVRDAQGNLRSTRDVLGEVADKFQTYGDGAGKAALAQELFGKAGANLPRGDGPHGRAARPDHRREHGAECRAVQRHA
ncbi:MAG: phage tail tape measure protein [Burkholderiaceae bacterium]|nr:phage tail tape measure protein [Burkholderiaceae bacterium]